MYKKKYECIIPKSRKGANAWEYGYYREKDMLTIEIPKYEIDQMFVRKEHDIYNESFIDAMYREFGLLIDIYEEETIPYDILPKVIKFLKMNRDIYDFPSFEKALYIGLKYKTYVDCWF